MKASKKMTPKFYQSLGKLFYAIAAADGKVRVEEFDLLKKLVREQWISVAAIEDSLGTDAAYQIEVIFNELHKQEVFDVKTYFDEFVHCKNTQQHLFTDAVKKLIIQTASSIAYAFAGINKAELMMLARLDIELKKT